MFGLPQSPQSHVNKNKSAQKGAEEKNDYLGGVLGEKNDTSA
jgi:hypothetical protein